MFEEFKKFAMRGNVVDLAVGVIIGAAFGKIVDSLVKDVIMPPIGLILGTVTIGFVPLRRWLRSRELHFGTAGIATGAAAFGLASGVTSGTGVILIAANYFMVRNSLNIAPEKARAVLRQMLRVN